MSNSKLLLNSHRLNSVINFLNFAKTARPTTSRGQARQFNIGPEFSRIHKFAHEIAHNRGMCVPARVWGEFYQQEELG